MVDCLIFVYQVLTSSLLRVRFIRSADRSRDIKIRFKQVQRVFLEIRTGEHMEFIEKSIFIVIDTMLKTALLMDVIRQRLNNWVVLLKANFAIK